VTQKDNTPFLKVTFYRWWPLMLAALLVVVRLLLPASVIEAVYSRGLFPALRYVWDFTLPFLSPFPLYYLFWALVVWWVWATVRRCRARVIEAGWGRATGFFLRRLLNASAGLVVVFLLAWGFNYGRQDVDERMGFSRYQPSLEELRQSVHEGADDLARWRRQIRSDSAALTAADLPVDTYLAVRDLVREALVKHDYPSPGQARGRQLRPEGILMRFSTAGVYWPWVGESNIDAGLHPLQKPAVMAHELAHAYGFGDEGTCTFWAWLAGQQTQGPALAYAFGLAYWRRIAGRLRMAEPEAYAAWRAASLDPGIRADLQAIYTNSARFKDIAPNIRNATYNTYLKAQGVDDGLLNYGTVVQLVEGYRKARSSAGSER